MVRKPLKATPPRKPAEPGVYLFVRISPDSVQVIKADRVADAPRQPLRAPLPANDAIPQFDDEVPELVLAAIHEDGTITESFGWPADPEWFVETNLEQALVSSQLQTLPVWEARWRIPMPDSVRYLQFSRSDLAWSAGRASPRKQTSLGVFDLKPGTPDRRRSRSWPVPDDRPPTPVPLPAVPASPALRSAAAPRARRAKAAKAKKKKGTGADGGFIKGSVTLVNHGDPSTKFNVVILGDGFTSANLSVFDTHATLVKKALTTTKPFKSLKSRINVYKVSVVSSESGITNCPTCGSTPKNTFFKTTGCFNGVPSSTFIGVSSTQKIFEAVDTAIPQQHAHLVVTIVNCRTGLGSTPPELGLVFLPLTAPGRTALDFMRDALHEAGHGIAKLNEEYNPCNKKKPTRVYPNEATQAEVDAGTVKWKHLARPSELDSSGNLKVVVRFGDPMRAGCKPVLRPSQSKSLGAFWGCHNGNPPATRTAGPAQDHCDPRGQHFYRPMADCRMRRAKAQFCRVCSDEITKVIEGHST